MVLVVGKTVKIYYIQNTGQLSEQCLHPHPRHAKQQDQYDIPLLQSHTFNPLKTNLRRIAESKGRPKRNKTKSNLFRLSLRFWITGFVTQHRPNLFVLLTTNTKARTDVWERVS
jgi:hypothetical protein